MQQQQLRLPCISQARSPACVSCSILFHCQSLVLYHRPGYSPCPDSTSSILPLPPSLPLYPFPPRPDRSPSPRPQTLARSAAARPSSPSTTSTTSLSTRSLSRSRSSLPAFLPVSVGLLSSGVDASVLGPAELRRSCPPQQRGPGSSAH